MTRVAVLAPEPIRPKMAGMGIRALELARALSAEHEVALVAPNALAEARAAAGDVPVVPLSKAEDLAAGLAAAVVSGHAATDWMRRFPEVPVAVDLYDPFPIENLHYAAALGDGPARHDAEAFAVALACGDFFLCASAEQRLFYAGALYTAGRIGPRNFPDDPALERLLAVVPFGVAAEPAAGDRVRGRRLAGVPPDGPLVLFGGVYDWYAPGPLLEAWPALRDAVPGARLLFFENPNPETTPQRAFEEVRARARRLDPAGQSIVFSPWLPYADRADLYAATDVLVSIAAYGLETDLSYRTRLLDAAWGGVPSVTVGGGALARELETAGAAVSSARDAPVLAASVREALASSARLGAAARAFAAGRGWPRVVAPLAAWCRAPRRDPGRRPLPAAAPSLWARLAARLDILPGE
jgi:hypothetical protein